MISEFLASNDNGLRDEDQNRPDWIEILNTGPNEASLGGWFLTDDPRDLDKWQFPRVSLKPNQRIVVFASGKNRRVPGGELHTNFRLNIEGDYLALVQPDGLTVAHDFGPRFPTQLKDVSFGLPQNIRQDISLPTGAPLRILVPTAENGGDVLGTSWTSIDFDDSTWTSGTTGIGYEQRNGYEELIATDVGAAMFGVNTTAYLRLPFVLDDPGAVYSIVLSMQYDDGYVAYINGREVARRNAPDDVTWNSRAPGPHPDREAVVPEDVEIDVIQLANLLRPGKNVLAIHALNDEVASTDFLIVPKLTVRQFEQLRSDQLQYFTAPSPGTPNGSGTTTAVIEVSHRPTVPTETDPLLVTAEVLSTAGPVASATLYYRVMFGDEVPVPMFDDGLHGDDAAGDGVFAARIPAGVASPGQMLRYRVTAGDTDESFARSPVFADPLYREQYFGTVVHDPSIQSQLRVLHLFVEDPTASERNAGTSGSLFYDGTFYDNIFIDTTGRTVGLAGPKKSHDIFFPDDHWFELQDLQYRMDDFDIINDFWNREKVRIPLAFETFRNIGVPAHLSFPVRVQRNGEFFATYSFVDEGNERFLARAGLDPRGALYKMNLGFTVVGSKKHTRTHEGTEDLRGFLNALKLTGQARTQYLMDNVNIPAVVNYLVGLVVVAHGDCCDKNLYVYRDTEGTGEWEALPWDLDSAFGRGGVGRAEPIFVEQAGIFAGRNNALFTAVFDDVPGFTEMYLRRLRSVMDDVLQPPGTPADQLKFERRIGEMVQQMAPDALLDFEKWGTWQTDPVTERITYGKENLPTWQDHINILKNDYFPARRVFLYDALTRANGGKVLEPQIGAPPIRIGEVDFSPASGNQDEEFIQLTNPNEMAVDISGWQLTGGVQHTFRPGTVIPSGSTLYVSPNVRVFRARASGPSGGQGLFVQGNYQGHISNHGATIRLIATDQTVVDQVTTPAQLTPAQKYLRVSEVMYHPRDTRLDDRFEADDYEFIELVNVSDTETVDLGNVVLSQGVRFAFPAMLLAPHERVVVVRNEAAFAERYGAGVNVAGQYGGTIDDFRLSNGGELVRLEIASGDLIQQFTYSDAWIPQTDGTGFSLTIVDPAGDLDRWDTAAGWQASRQPDGSPGTGDSTSGDFTGDGRVDIADIDLFCAGLRAGNLQGDLTGDGFADRADLTYLIKTILGTTFGDSNLDGRFDTPDLVRVFQSGEYEDGAVSNSTWAEGDWNCDGDFDTGDFVVAFQAGGYVAAAAAAVLPAGEWSEGRAAVAANVRSTQSAGSPTRRTGESETGQQMASAAPLPPIVGATGEPIVWSARLDNAVARDEVFAGANRRLDWCSDAMAEDLILSLPSIVEILPPCRE